MKASNLGLFLILVGLCMVFIHKNTGCPKPKPDYRYISRNVLNDYEKYKIDSDETIFDQKNIFLDKES